MAETETNVKNTNGKVWLVIPYVIIGILVIWAFVQNAKISKLEDKTQILNQIEQKDLYWSCIDWYGSCGNMVYDNESGMFLPEGMIDSGCDGACARFSLQRMNDLPTIPASDLIGG